MMESPAPPGPTGEDRGLARFNFAPIAVGGWGDGLNSYAHSMAWYQGRLDTSPVETARHTLNMSPYPIVFESVDPARGEWRPVSEMGFGDARNVAIFE